MVKSENTLSHDNQGRRRGLRAATTGHYHASIAAMMHATDTASLMRHFEPSRRATSIAQRLAPPIGNAFARRSKFPLDPAIATYSLGLGQFIAPAALRLGVEYGPRSKRTANRMMARQVARRANGMDVLHFDEGIGWQALRAQRGGFTIMERRSFHHRDYEKSIEPLAGFPYSPKKDPLRDYLDEEYARADRVLTYSRCQLESLARHGVERDKLRIAPIPVSTQHDYVATDSVRKGFAFVGRLDVHKGVDVACAAIAMLGGDAHLFVAGPATGDVRDWILRQPHVTYLGLLNRQELSALYSRVRALIAPSVESFGLAPLDAVMHGVHVIARETTGVAEYLPSASATIISGRDPRNWANAIANHNHAEPTSSDVSHALTNEVKQNLSFETARLALERVYAEAYSA